MSKILRNDSLSDVVITDTGVTVSASTSYTIPPQDYSTFAASSDVITLLSNGSLVLNDGGNDVSPLSRAIDVIKGFPPQITSPFFFDPTNAPVGIKILQNLLTGDGLAPNSVKIDDSPSGITGILALVFRNAIGNLVAPQLDAAGRLPVTFEGFSGFSKSGVGELEPGSSTMVDVTGASITLDNSKTYGSIRANLSCFRDCLFNIVFDDNGAATIIGQARLTSTQTTFEWTAGSQLVTSGSTGPQTLKIQAKNPNALSTITAEISCVEVG